MNEDTMHYVVLLDRAITDVSLLAPPFSSVTSAVVNSRNDTELRIELDGAAWTIEYHNEHFKTEPITTALQMCWFRNYSHREIAELRQHKCWLDVRLSTRAELPFVRAHHISQVLRILAKTTQATGVLNVPAQHYTSREQIVSFFSSDDESLAMFKLLINLHVDDQAGESWFHTHGMQQFGLPDIEIWASLDAVKSQFTELLLNAAHYQMLGQGVLRIGDTFHLTTESFAYEVIPARKQISNHFSPRSAIQLTLQIIK